VYDLCGEELQRKLRTNRIVNDKAFEAELALKRAKNSADATPGTSSSANLFPATPVAGKIRTLLCSTRAFLWCL
jgi:hypothetical protein